FAAGETVRARHLLRKSAPNFAPRYISGRAADVESAVAVLRRARPQVLLGEAQRRTLAALSGSVPEPSAELGEVRHA
ncbi:hypothetical protein ACR3ID_31270, partial [Pseudomonas aeruginosa]